MRKTISLIFCIGTISWFLMSCAIEPEFSEKPGTPPPIKYCNDATGHIKGKKPWILGGECCCTPTKERFESYKEEGTVPDKMEYESFLNLFKQKGINTDLDLRYRYTNNLNPFGPHVVKGGHDMGTPTSGTKNYEEVVSGVFRIDETEKKEVQEYYENLKSREKQIEKEKGK